MSTFSSNLRIELIGSGEQANTWGNTTNTNLGTIIEAAIAGSVSVDVTAANVTLTTANGAADQARNMILNITGTPGVARTVYCPNSVTKVYVVANNSNAAVTVSTVSGTGVSITAGYVRHLYCNGTNVYPVSVPVALATFSTLLSNPIINGFTGDTSVVNIGSNQIYKDTSGNVGFGVVPTAGINAAVQTKNGVKFPATQVASTDPNVLDDYEEGSLLPTISFVNPGTGTISTVNRYGTYVKVGKQVTCSVRCEVSSVSVGTATGGIYIDALPFFSESATYASYAASVVAINFVTAPTIGYVTNASKSIVLYKMTTSGVTAMAVTDIQAGSIITATVSYFVD